MEDFIKKAKDLYNRSVNKNIITYTGFLTPAERYNIEKEINNSNIVFCGGSESSERTRAFFLPDYIAEVKVEEYIVAFKAIFSFKELSHRDFLGALLSLGIERKCIGDIYVFEKEAYFFVTKDIAEFVELNLTKVSTIGVKLEQVDLDRVRVHEPSFKEITFTSPSMRLDSIVAGSVKESREKVSVYIKNGIVMLNYIVCDNPSELLNKGDIFSVKGFGKFRLDEVVGKTRKDRLVLKVLKYV